MYHSDKMKQIISVQMTSYVRQLTAIWFKNKTILYKDRVVSAIKKLNKLHLEAQLLPKSNMKAPLQTSRMLSVQSINPKLATKSNRIILEYIVRGNLIISSVKTNKKVNIVKIQRCRHQILILKAIHSANKTMNSVLKSKISKIKGLFSR